MEQNYLKGDRISLSHLSAWLFRFTAFEFDEKPNDKQFTRVVERAIRKFLKITKNDFLWLFDDDLSTRRLTPSRNGITGAELRNCFSFNAGKEPDIQGGTTGQPLNSCIEHAVVEKYLALNGDNPSDTDIFNTLLNKKQIVLTGVPGVGKSRYTKNLCDIEIDGKRFFKESRTIQFHAGYAYEDFIGAEVMMTEDKVNYMSTRMGAFLSFIEKAKKNPDDNYLFVIDELNRGNIAEIFGETILALDRSYTVELNRDYDGVRTMNIPENLYIVGTMNTSDRNIAFLDLAIRRRFAFISLMPNYDFLSEEVVLDDIDLGNVLREINRRIVAVLKDPELMLGQSYFIPAETGAGFRWGFDDFKNQFNFVLLPTIKEYSFNDPSAVNSIVGENLGDGIQDTDDFEVAFRAEFSL